MNVLARSDFITNIVLTLCVPQLSELDSNGACGFIKRGNGVGDNVPFIKLEHEN